MFLSSDRRRNPASKQYDYRMISERLEALNKAHAEEDVAGMVNLLRSGRFSTLVVYGV